MMGMGGGGGGNMMMAGAGGLMAGMLLGEVFK